MTEKLEWSTFAVPYRFIKNYILLMIFALWFLPGIMSLRFTMYGYILNFLWADFMFYLWYKAKLRAQIEWEKRQKLREWRDDDKSDRMD
jgi:hypothetical protein|tara:strand:- start:8 stop:274 length:267 start_codon:yes stop_codon:yes gene_type:complete